MSSNESTKTSTFIATFLQISLRTYSVEEMNELIASLSNKEIFNWEVGKVKSAVGKILYLLGMKK